MLIVLEKNAVNQTDEVEALAMKRGTLLNEMEFCRVETSKM